MATLKSRWMISIEIEGIHYVVTKSWPKVGMGIIYFCTQWKHFIFVPEGERQFSDRCLSDLAAFLAELNKEKG